MEEAAGREAGLRTGWAKTPETNKSVSNAAMRHSERERKQKEDNHRMREDDGEEDEARAEEEGSRKGLEAV